MEKKEQKNTQAKKMLQGTVVSDVLQGSVVVTVERYVKHPKYGKYMRQQKKYIVDDPGNTHKIGDVVTIKESRPISKTKRFRIMENES